MSAHGEAQPADRPRQLQQQQQHERLTPHECHGGRVDANLHAQQRHGTQRVPAPVAGLERAGRTRTAPSAPSAAKGWKYYYAAQAIIFCRPRGAEPRTDDQMLQLARRVAASADPAPLPTSLQG
jgi:hypothetical protein